MAWTINGETPGTGNTPPASALRRKLVPSGGEAWTWSLYIRGDFDTTDEILLPNIPTPCKLGPFIANLIDGDSGATTLQPALGTIPGWTSGAKGHVVAAASADANHRIEGNASGAVVMIGVSPSGQGLSIRPAPDAQFGASGEFLIELTLLTGSL